MNFVDFLVSNILWRPVLGCFQGMGVSVVLPDGKKFNLGSESSSDDPPIYISNWSVFLDLLWGYDLGLAGSYISGKWHHEELPDLFSRLSSQVGSSNTSVLAKIAPKKLIARVEQMIRASNTIWWASRNVSSHYDKSNEFFSYFLDSSMTYSCGIFDNPDATLREAQQNKLDTLFKKSVMKAGDNVLDIGCGWGGLISRAVEMYDVKVTGVTLSKEQYDYTRSLLRSLGIEQFAGVVLQDYRRTQGKYDHIFSVEMLEAVGHKGIYEFFDKSWDLLSERGSLQVQVITIPDDRYDSYRTNCDFIQKYVFPGGLLPSLKVVNEAARISGFRLVESTSIGKHYATTLKQWRDRLNENREDILKAGFSEEDLRRFDYYFSYCEGAFRAQRIDNFQLSYVKA